MDKALRALVSAAYKGGGEDNITVVAFEIAEEALASDGDTREQVLPDDEDTLTEVDGVPAVEPEAEPVEGRPARDRSVDTMVVPVAAIQARVAEEEAQERKVRRRHLRRRTVAWLALVLIVAAVGLALYLRFVG